jgi:hypothetical protein
LYGIAPGYKRAGWRYPEGEIGLYQLGGLGQIPFGCGFEIQV